MIKVAHVITGLGTGGAETMLLKLLTRMDRERFEARVYSLTDAGSRGPMIEALGIPVVALGMRREVPDPPRLLRLARELRRQRPDVVQTWMYHADLLGAVASKVGGPRTPVVWNIRQSTFDPAAARGRTVQVAKLCARLSGWLPHTVICCSHRAREVHVAMGYADRKIDVIPNGFDLSRFRPNPSDRLAVRAELGIPAGAPVVGTVARFHPQKDHRTLVAAAARLRARVPDAHFLLCGPETTPGNPALREWIDAAGMSSAFRLLGDRGDVPRLVAAVDVLCSSSAFGEGFPNVVGEAMACGVPCVVTDVGDSAWVVGDTGRVVPPGDPAALGDALGELLTGSTDYRRALGARARRRVEEHFAIERVTRTYEDVYRRAIAGPTVAVGRRAAARGGPTP